jgi:hypothetical protein
VGLYGPPPFTVTEAEEAPETMMGARPIPMAAGRNLTVFMTAALDGLVEVFGS